MKPWKVESRWKLWAEREVFRHFAAHALALILEEEQDPKRVAELLQDGLEDMSPGEFAPRDFAERATDWREDDPYYEGRAETRKDICENAKRLMQGALADY